MLPKILNYYHAEYGTIFWDQDQKIITAIHENDGTYRDEYFDALFEHFGIRPVYHKKKPSFLTKKVLREHGVEE